MQIPGWSDKQRLRFPAPIGSVPSYSFSSADPWLFAQRFSFEDLRVGVAFELAIARWAFSVFKVLANMGLHRLVEAMVILSLPLFSLTRRFGSQRGAVTVIMRGERDGATRAYSASIFSDAKGQRMASLPCVIAAEAIARGECKGRGLLALHEWLEPEAFLARLEDKGMQLIVEER